MNFHILTLFPEMVMDGLNTSIIGRAMENGLLTIEAVNIRDFAENKHNRVDDYTYGGGAGMLMQAGPVYGAYQSVAERIKNKPRVIYLSPQGQTFSQGMAEDFAKEDELVFLCGHYEGIDERVLEEIVTDYVSIGDYVLTGGEIPSMIVADSVIRLLGQAIKQESHEDDSFSNGLLEYPQYTRPLEYNGMVVPEVLVNGNHKLINRFRKKESLRKTYLRRPDLLENYEFSKEDRKLMDEILEEESKADRN